MDKVTVKARLSAAVISCYAISLSLPLFLGTGCGKDDSQSAEIAPAPQAPTAVALTVNNAGPTPPGQQPQPVAAAAEAPTPTLDQLPQPPSDAEKLTLEQISAAIQQYVAAHEMDPRLFTEKDLPKLVTEKFITYWTPPPAGKKYVWDARLVVSLANK